MNEDEDRAWASLLLGGTCAALEMVIGMAYDSASGIGPSEEWDAIQKTETLLKVLKGMVKEMQP